MAFGSIFTRYGAAVVGLLSGGAASRAVRPIFELVEQESWDGNPNRLLPPPQLAELVATALTDIGAVTGEARRQGLQDTRLQALVQLALRTPTIGQAMAARQRDAITAEQYRHVLRKAGIEPQYDEAMFALLDVLPSVQDMVRFGVREVYDPQQRAFLNLDAEFPGGFAADAARIGLSRTTAGNYWAAHWELPSYVQFATMLFRKLLSPQEFRDALKAADYAPVWRDKLAEIARAIPTITDMVRFAVREVYDDATRAALGIDAEYPDAFTAEAALHGMSETHARQYWAAHWRLPSARQGYQMVWRNEMELPELRTLLKALDYPPKWRDRLFNIAFIVPGRIDLKRMLRHGILEREQVKEGYQRIGYDPANAELMTQIAEAELETGAVEQRWAERARGRLFTAAHNDYMDGNADEADARALLAPLGLAPGEADVIVGLWNLERASTRRDLTQAQILKLAKKGIWVREQAQVTLEDMGMEAVDASALLDATLQ